MEGQHDDVFTMIAALREAEADGGCDRGANQNATGCQAGAKSAGVCDGTIGILKVARAGCRASLRKVV